MLLALWHAHFEQGEAPPPPPTPPKEGISSGGGIGYGWKTSPENNELYQKYKRQKDEEERLERESKEVKLRPKTKDLAEPITVNSDLRDKRIASRFLEAAIEQELENYELILDQQEQEKIALLLKKQDDELALILLLS
jgi:hypothetical protein